MDSIRPTPAAPSADPERTRIAYLDLLKLALCDLVAAETETVVPTPDGPVAHRLSEKDLSFRIRGSEWPLRGLTMIGYSRLADLQRCIETIVGDGVEGDVIEAGVWRGGASMLVRATLDSLGEEKRTVWIADSFRGLPPPDDGFPEDSDNRLYMHDYLAVPQPYVEAGFQRLGLDHDLQFVEGFFAETMPGLNDRRWSLIRLDGDMYESTWITLEALYPGLARGGYVVFDDYGDVPEGKRAMDDFRKAHRIETPLEWADHSCVRWRREDDPEAAGTAQLPERVRRSAPEVTRPDNVNVRSARELELEQELTVQANRLADEIAARGRQHAGAAAVRTLLGRLRGRLRNRLRR